MQKVSIEQALSSLTKGNFIGKFDFDLLKEGKLLKRIPWKGYWKWENNTIMIYCKTGLVLDIRDTKDVSFTMENMFKEDWEITDGKVLEEYLKENN